MRCAAQVHGAARDALSFIRRTVAIESNAATDNPMVFADTGAIVSGGNFHGAPIAIAADLLVIALAQFATISERRSDRLLNPAFSGLPAFLTLDGGLQSGLMMAQVTAAALTSELKVLAHPASVDTIPTSGNKEDHVSMSMAAALKAERAVVLARQVVAIELLCAAQALDLLAPLTTSVPLTRVHDTIRARVATLARDRPPSPDIAAIDESDRDRGDRSRARRRCQLAPEIFELTTRAAVLSLLSFPTACDASGFAQWTPHHASIRAPRGSTRTCKGWPQEAALRMLMNNLDPDVAERPQDLVVYGGSGRAARNWPAFDAIVASLPRARGRRDAARAVGQAGRRCSGRIARRRASSLPTRCSCPPGPRSSTSATSRTAASPCTAR